MNTKKNKSAVGRPRRKPTSVSGAFADTLFELIVEKKETENRGQNEIASDLGVAGGTLSSWVNNAKTPGDIETYIRIADYFNVSLDYLMGRTIERTRDVESIEIHEKTGLSVKAIERILWCKKTDLIADIKLLNSILESDSVVFFLLEFGRAIKCCNSVRNFLSEFEKLTPSENEKILSERIKGAGTEAGVDTLLDVFNRDFVQNDIMKEFYSCMYSLNDQLSLLVDELCNYRDLQQEINIEVAKRLL